jgi:glycosyltransferase involved in cell wall biosynthesis
VIGELRRQVGAAKGRGVRGLGAAVAWGRRRRPPAEYRPGTTVVTVNWNSLPFLRPMLAATRAMSPPHTEILVVDNGSSDGSDEYVRGLGGVGLMRLPVNVGHGVALDLALAGVDTEYVAVLDVDAFPVSSDWLDASIAALELGAQVAGAHMHRNFVHPCFLVTRTKVVHDLDLTFRPVGSLSGLDRGAPLFLDVGEALSQRVIVKFGGGRALHFFEITEALGPGPARAVFGGLVYHNMFATQGTGRSDALTVFQDRIAREHPDLVV